MKTRKQKVITILASVFLLASFCLFPLAVSADGYNSYTFNLPRYGDDHNSEFFRFAKLVDTLNSANWNSLNRADTLFFIGTDVNNPQGAGYDWTWPASYQGYSGCCSFYLGYSDFGYSSYNKTDTVWVDPFDLTFFFPHMYTGTTQFRISFRSVDKSKGLMDGVGPSIGRSSWITFNYQNYIDGGTATVSVPKTEIHILDPGQYDGLAVCIDIVCLSGQSQIGIGYLNDTFCINYAQGTNPNLPAYNGPAGSSDIANMESMESDLVSGSQSGLNEAVSLFNSLSSSINSFRSGLVVASNIISKFITIAPFRIIVDISLTLGILGSLLALSGSIISASDRRASSARSGQRSKK